MEDRYIHFNVKCIGESDKLYDISVLKNIKIRPFDVQFLILWMYA